MDFSESTLTDELLDAVQPFDGHAVTDIAPILPTGFEADNFAVRRTGGPNSYGVAYDPESLISGAEELAGLTYADKRLWPSREVYAAAVAGRLTPEDVLAIAPRHEGLRVPSYRTHTPNPIYRAGESEPLPVGQSPNRLYTRGA